jgi:hypothetical protein
MVQSEPIAVEASYYKAQRLDSSDINSVRWNGYGHLKSISMFWLVDFPPEKYTINHRPINPNKSPFPGVGFLNFNPIFTKTGTTDCQRDA